MKKLCKIKMYSVKEASRLVYDGSLIEYEDYPSKYVGNYKNYQIDIILLNEEGNEVIASTDPKLNLPTISSDFINHYISARNDGYKVKKIYTLYSEDGNLIVSEDNTIQLEKYTPPMKKNQVMAIYPVCDEIYETMYTCSNCNGGYIFEDFKYCPHCRKKLYIDTFTYGIN